VRRLDIRIAPTNYVSVKSRISRQIPTKHQPAFAVATASRGCCADVYWLITCCRPIRTTEAMFCTSRLESHFALTK
jgi:hypothetical protein